MRWALTAVISILCPRSFDCACNFAAVQRVAQQHGDGQRADAAGHGRDVAGYFFDRLEIHVAHQTAIGAVDAHVDHRRAGLDHVGGDEFRLADGHDEDVGRAADFGQIVGAAVADRDRGVAARAALHEHDRHGLAHDVAAAQHDHVRAGDFDIVANEQLLDRRGACTAEIAAGLARSGPRSRDEAHRRPLAGLIASSTCVFVYLLGQGELNQDAVDFRIAIEPVDQGQQFGRSGFGF